MRKSPRRVGSWSVLVAVLAALALVGAMGASAKDGHGRDDAARASHERGHDDHGGRPLLRSSLAPSVPTDTAIHGVAAGAVPWVLSRGTVLLQENGRLRLRLKGLVIPVAHGTFPAGTARPVTVVSASLYCAPDSAAAAATTASAPISEGGDATIDERVTLPSTCLAPIVLVHPNGDAGHYISVTGWR